MDSQNEDIKDGLRCPECDGKLWWEHAKTGKLAAHLSATDLLRADGTLAYEPHCKNCGATVQTGQYP